ncbi:MAG: outer rane efflux protein [Myxococcales bacterium]|nr:outer rane efflux protein [Myxococcales bacterium]
MATAATLLALVTPARAEPTTLSFAEAMRRAFARNPDMLIAMEEIARAHAIVEEVRAGSLPTLSAVATFTQLDSPRLSITSPGAILLPGTQFNGAGTAALTLDPRRWVQWSQARENVRTTRLNAGDVRRRLALAVGQTYLSVLAQRQIVQADQLAVQNATAHVDYTRLRLEGGNGTLLDFQRANALYNSDRALLDRAQFLLAQLQEQLGILLGENAAVDATADVQLPDAPVDPKVALDDAQRLRIDLHLSQELLTAATKVRRESWADFMPWATASFEGFYQTPPTQTVPTRGWQLLVTLTLPIYDGGLRYGLLKERRALEHEAGIRVDAELRLVSSSVRTALVELERARTALGSAREAARLDADVVRLTTISYRAGLSTNIEVIDAQLAALNADVNAALAANNERQAQLDLLLATGRFP